MKHPIKAECQNYGILSPQQAVNHYILAHIKLSNYVRIYTCIYVYQLAESPIMIWKGHNISCFSKKKIVAYYKLHNFFGKRLYVFVISIDSSHSSALISLLSIKISYQLLNTITKKMNSLRYFIFHQNIRVMSE